MIEYFKEEPRYSITYLDGDGQCDEQDGLIKIVSFRKERSNKLPEHYVKFYSGGPNANNPVNPSNLDSKFDRYQTFIWTKVRKEDYQAYLSFITRGGSYQRIVDLFSSRY
jgi:hypothetical protein